jgi:ankyrin repeat protein
VVRVQTLYRGLKSREVLKQLQIEARDVNVLKAERDKFREETLRLRRELEAKDSKQRELLLAQTNGIANKSVAADRRSEFETQPRKEKITKYEKEIQSLAALSAEKDAELAKLRDEIAFLRSPGGISIIHEQLSFVSSPARSQNTPEKAVHTADGQDRSFSVDIPQFRKAVHEYDDKYVPSPERFRNTPERAVQTIRSGGRSPTSTNRSLFSTKSSPATSERSRGGVGSPALGLSLLDAVGLDDTGIMGVSPMSKHISGVSWSSVSSPPRSQITPAKAIHTISNRVDVSGDSVGSTDGQHKSFSIDALRFRKAVHEGDSETVEKFLRESNLRDVLINECDESGRSPLHVAVIESRWKVVGALLGSDAAANAQDLAGNTPLHVAPNASMMALLLKEGRANPNIPNMNGECALHLAVKKLDDAAVEVLLQHRADVNCADNTKWYTPIHLIAQADMDERAHLELLQNEFEDETHKRVRIATLLCGATDPFLFRCEPDLNYQDWEGNTPLHHVVMLTSEPAGEMLTIFLESGAKPQIVNNRGQTALHLLCHNDSLRKLEVFQEMLHDMLYHGADPNQTSLTGCTPLHLSLYHRDVDSAIQLVNSGAELHLLWRKVGIRVRIV